MKQIVLVLGLLVLSACASYGPQVEQPNEIAALAAEIRALSPAVDALEADEAARLAFKTTRALALAYQITDPPLIHNSKVNAGLRPRGLCYHWAEDLQAQLKGARFATLDIERAIANAENPILIDHSTAVIVARGADMETGIVIDPWRYGGRLFWAPVIEDTRYDWVEREAILRKLGRIRYVQRTAGSRAPPPVE